MLWYEGKKPFKFYQEDMIMRNNKTFHFRQSLNGFLSRYLPPEMKALLVTRNKNCYYGKKTLNERGIRKKLNLGDVLFNLQVV